MAHQVGTFQPAGRTRDDGAGAAGSRRIHRSRVVQQIGFERTANEEIETYLDNPEYESLELVAVRVQYNGLGSFGSPETLTLTMSRTTDGDPPQIADEIDDRIAAATGHNIQIRVRFIEYQRSDNAEPSQAVGYQ